MISEMVRIPRVDLSREDDPYFPTKEIENAEKDLAAKMGDSELARAKVILFRERVKPLAQEILNEFGEILQEYNAYCKNGLMSRGSSVIVKSVNNPDHLKLAKWGAVLPSFCFYRSPLKMPDKPLDQQNNDELARTLALSQSYFIDSAMNRMFKFYPGGQGDPKVNAIFHKVWPAVRKRMLLECEKTFRAEWIREDLLTHVKFLHSDTGRRAVDYELEKSVMLEQEKQKVLQEFRTEKRQQEMKPLLDLLKTF